jgi:hypothetical protein
LLFVPNLHRGYRDDVTIWLHPILALRLVVTSALRRAR